MPAPLADKPAIEVALSLWALSVDRLRSEGKSWPFIDEMGKREIHAKGVQALSWLGPLPAINDKVRRKLVNLPRTLAELERLAA